MVRQKVRTCFLLFKKLRNKNPKGKEKGKNSILTLKKKKSHGKVATPRVRKNVKNSTVSLKKKSNGKTKGKSPILK